MSNSESTTIEPVAVAPNTAARMLDVSRSKIYDLMKGGQLSFVFIGADRRIPIEEIRKIASQGFPK
jgi:excisionase family DNA binding protein